MNNKTIGLLSLVMIVFLSSGFTDVTKTDIDNTIDKSKLKHPYLYFSDEDKPAMLKLIKSDPESRNIMNQLLVKANMLINMPVERTIPIQGRNTRAGWTEYDRDGKYEEFYTSNQENAFTLAFVYQMTGDQKYADKAFEFADAFCDLPSWTRRAHEFPIIYSRIMPWNVPDDQVRLRLRVPHRP